MKFASSALLLLASTATTAAFAPAKVSADTHVRLAATVEEKVTGTKLIPPVSQSEIWSEAGRVSSIYDSNVQKTYGYVYRIMRRYRYERAYLS